MNGVRSIQWPVPAWLGLVLAVSMHGVHADEFSPESTLYRQLLTPMTSVIDGKPFREALEQVAAQGRVNLCVDRRVDPTAPVSPGGLGPNIYSSIKQIAQQRDCVVMPVAGVLLVGRAEWVDATAGSLMMLTESGNAAAATIRWPDLTTPSEALRSAAGDSAGNIALPHDLWPSTRWTAIDRRVATALVLAQFDRRPSEGSLSGQAPLVLVPVESIGRCTRRYRTGKHSALLRQSLKQADEENKVRTVRNSLEVLATATAHRAATDALLGKIAVPKNPQPQDDQRRFSLDLKAPAGDAIRKFAATANIACVIEQNAEAACRSFVTLSAKDKSLRELIEMVAKKADLTATWHDNKVVISKK